MPRIPKAHHCGRLEGMGPENTQSPPTAGARTAAGRVCYDGTDTSLSEALTTLRKRRWVLILAVLLGLAYGIFWAVYAAEALRGIGTIQVHRAPPTNINVDAVPGYDADDSQSKMNTEVAILKSDTLMENVATIWTWPIIRTFSRCMAGPAA